MAKSKKDIIDIASLSVHPKLKESIVFPKREQNTDVDSLIDKYQNALLNQQKRLKVESQHLEFLSEDEKAFLTDTIQSDQYNIKHLVQELRNTKQQLQSQIESKQEFIYAHEDDYLINNSHMKCNTKIVFLQKVKDNIEHLRQSITRIENCLQSS